MTVRLSKRKLKAVQRALRLAYSNEPTNSDYADALAWAVEETERRAAGGQSWLRHNTRGSHER